MDDQPYQFHFMHYRLSSMPKKRKGMPKQTLIRYSPRLHGWMMANGQFVQAVSDPSPRGGMTVCVIYQNGRAIAVGRAICSLSDTFSYKRGREIAKGRALKQLKGENAQ